MKLRRLLPSFCALAALCMATAALAGPVGTTDAPEAPPVKLQDPADLEGLALPKGLAADAVKPTTVDAAANATRAARQARLAAFIAEREAQAASRPAQGGGARNAMPEARTAPAPKPQAEGSLLLDNPAAELEKSATAEKENTGKVPERVTYSSPAGDGHNNFDTGGSSQRGLSDSMTPQQRDLAREAINDVKGLLADPLTWFLLIPVGLGVAALAVMARRG
ncbi:hypothetical protein BH11PSE9_BH11PSE9_35780 [soil metagenome]